MVRDLGRSYAVVYSRYKCSALTCPGVMDAREKYSAAQAKLPIAERKEKASNLLGQQFVAYCTWCRNSMVRTYLIVLTLYHSFVISINVLLIAGVCVCRSIQHWLNTRVTTCTRNSIEVLIRCQVGPQVVGHRRKIDAELA